MKLLKVFFPLVIVLLFLTSASGSKSDKEKPVYAFGVAFSLSQDSTVYFTEMQSLDSVTLENKYLLPSRSTYTYQLKSYLENKRELPDRTCVIYFSPNKNKLTKEYNKVVARYKKDKDVRIINLKEEEFRFTKPLY